MHRILKLQHHRHTGKLLPHHHTSYRTLGVLLAITGAFLVLMQHSAGADTLYVRAKISAPLPIAPAVILAPTDGYQTSTGLVTVSGTCPGTTPSNIVVILEDAATIGSTPCLLDETFSTEVTLHPGSHIITAQIYNFTEDAGPAGIAITATYTPPVPLIPPTPTPTPTQPTPVTTPTPATVPTPTAPSLAISSERNYFTFGPNSPVTWEGRFEGGTAPYTVRIDWGDGTSSVYIVKDSSLQRFSHYYENMSAFKITLTVIDSNGGSYSGSFAAVTPYVSRNDGPTTPNGIQYSYPPVHDKLTAIGVYAAYALAVVLVGLIWIDAHVLRPQSVIHALPPHAKSRTKTQKHHTRATSAHRTKTAKGRHT
jgi:hypothetical protein